MTGFSTRAIHNGEEPDFRDGASGDVAVPIHLSTTFARLRADSPTAGYEYTRSLNPTRKALEEKLAARWCSTMMIFTRNSLIIRTLWARCFRRLIVI